MFTDLNSVARNEDIFLIDVEVGMWNGGKIGCAPLVEIGNELEGEFGQLVADSRQNKGAGGRQAEGGTVERAENTTSWCHTVLVATGEAATNAMA